MKVTAVAHFALCVRDLEKSIHFYRDILGMKVTIKESQPMENRPGATSQAMYENQHASRVTAHVAFDGAASTAPFLVLSSHPGDHLSGQPIKLDQIGITHISFVVDDVKRVADELMAKGIPPAGDLEDFYEKKATLRTFFVHDPDGILVQFEAAG